MNKDKITAEWHYTSVSIFENDEDWYCCSHCGTLAEGATDGEPIFAKTCLYCHATMLNAEPTKQPMREDKT